MRWIITKKGNRVQRPRILAGTPERIGGEHFSQRWLSRDFWVQVVSSKAEYRQHIFGDKAIRSGMKVKVEPGISPLLVRSRRNGWHLNYGEWPRPERLKEVAKSAVGALGYTHGACDILEKDDGTLVILEVNSAPSVEDANTLIAYKRAITLWAQKEA